MLTNCTLSGNSGVGILNFGGDREGIATLTNTIVANSLDGGNCDGVAIVDGGHNLSSDDTCVSGPGTDPRLALLASYGGPTATLALCTAVGIPDPSCSGPSPAIDAGDQSVCAAAPVNDRDQHGFERPVPATPTAPLAPTRPTQLRSKRALVTCDGTGSVTIDKIITLVNIALGTAEPSACPNGVVSDTDVNVARIIQAVNAASGGCAG